MHVHPSPGQEPEGHSSVCGHDHDAAASTQASGQGDIMPRADGAAQVQLSCCSHDSATPHESGHAHGASTTAWWTFALAGVAAIAAEILGWIGAPDWTSLGLALIAIAISGLGVYRQGLASLLKGDLNINALMSIAVSGAILLGHWPEAAMVMVLFTIAEAIEEKSLDRARNAIGKLMEVAPERVMALGEGGLWAELPAAQVQPGTTLRARPGERIGLDGVVTAGQSAVNQAPITGESIPVGKAPGDTIYAGSINGMAELEYRVTAGFRDTTLARIINAVQQAQSRKAPMQRFVDQFARIYTPIVCVIALAVAVLPPLVAGAAWSEWVYKALVLLVIACPCALVISTPVAVVSGLAAAARHGILIKGGVYLERGRKLRWMLLDKTGTLTTGQPVLKDLVCLDAALSQGALPCAGRQPWRAIRSSGIPRHRPGQHTDASGCGRFPGNPGRGRARGIAGTSYFLGSPTWLAAALGETGRQAVDALQAQGAHGHGPGPAG